MLKTKKTIVKNLIVFGSGNILSLLLAVITQFLLPKMLSVESFGLYKTFVLYLSYTSLFHLGFKDGLYVKMCEADNIYDVQSKGYTLLFIQLLITAIIGAIYAFFIADTYSFLIGSLSVTSFFFILITFYDSYYQAKKEFKKSVRFKLLREGLFLFAILIGGQILLIDFFGVIYIYLVSIIIVCIFFALSLRKELKLVVINLKDLLKFRPVYVRGGKILAGNFGHQLNGNLDKLFVSLVYSSSIFAVYSFGGMFLVLTNLLIASMSTVLLPYLFKEFKNDLDVKYKSISTWLYLSMMVVVPIYFSIIFFVVEQFYEKYNESLIIIAIFAIAVPFSAKISLQHNSYLKVYKLESSYAIINFLAILLILVGCGIIYFSDGPIFFYAILSVLIFIIRYVVNELTLKSCLGLSNFEIVKGLALLLVPGITTLGGFYYLR